MRNKLLLQTEDFKPSFANWRIAGVMNPAAIRLENKKILLMVRVAERAEHYHKRKRVCPVFTSREESEVKYQEQNKKHGKGEWNTLYLKDGACYLPTISHFKRVLLNEDGFHIEEIMNEPAFVGTQDDGEYGVEDPRIVKIKDKYYMTYVSISKFNGVSTSLACTKDFKNWEREGLIFSEQNKDCVLFPEKIKYVETVMIFLSPIIFIIKVQRFLLGSIFFRRK